MHFCRPEFLYLSESALGNFPDSFKLQCTYYHRPIIISGRVDFRIIFQRVLCPNHECPTYPPCANLFEWHWQVKKDQTLLRLVQFALFPIPLYLHKNELSKLWIICGLHCVIYGGKTKSLSLCLFILANTKKTIQVCEKSLPP